MLESKEKVFSILPTTGKVEQIVEWLEEKKAEDLLALDLSGMSTFTDAVVIATASSMRHGKALAEFVREQAKKNNFEVLRAEGMDAAQWILLDLNDVVVNIFLDDVRGLFNLESLWAEAGVLHKSDKE